MARATQDEKQVITAATANGFGTPMKVTDFRHLILFLTASANSTLTFKVQGSNQELKKGPNDSTTAEPGGVDFTAAASSTNRWSYISVNDLDTGGNAPGSTGIALTNASLVNMYEISTNGLTWVNVQITDYSAGTANAWIKPFNDMP